MTATSALHRDARQRVASMPPEPLRERFLAYLDQHPDALSRNCRPHHLTASTLVVSHDATQVLLTLHAKAQQWFQFGGHCEDDVSLLAAARREAHEESGLAALRFDPSPIHLDEHVVPFCNPGGAEPTRHLDVRFLAVAAPGAVPSASDESADVAWWPVHELPSDEESLHALVRAGLERVGRSGEPRSSVRSGDVPGLAR